LSCVWNRQCEDIIPYIEEKNEEEDPNIEDKNPSKSNSTTVIIIIVIVVTALIGAIILIIIIIYRRKASGKVKDGEKTSEMDELTRMSFSSSIQKSQRKTGLYCD
jgi:flagellar basal body-associated protein FliL